jgi:carbon starvation protein CstA
MAMAGTQDIRLEGFHPVPSRELEDGIDYVPSRKGMLFGHHFTSIAEQGRLSARRLANLGVAAGAAVVTLGVFLWSGARFRGPGGIASKRR